MESFTVETFTECTAGVLTSMLDAATRQLVNIDRDCFVTQIAIWTNYYKTVDVNCIIDNIEINTTFANDAAIFYIDVNGPQYGSQTHSCDVRASADCIVYCTFKMCRVLRANPN